MRINQSKITLLDKKITFRLLKSYDNVVLIDFFTNFSENLKKWYNPHPFDKKTVIEICNNIEDKYKRVIGVCDGKIVSYCQLFFGLRYWENVRFNKRGIYFNDNSVCTIAPCVAENLQNKGLGSNMMEYIISVCKKYNKQYIILHGGVVVKNKRAVAYYEKNNFKKTKKWFHPLAKVMNYDMFLKI